MDTKSPQTEDLFLHETRSIWFALVVDDSGIKYTQKEDVYHLMTSVQEKYPFKIDLDTKQYTGINLKWNYDKRKDRVSVDLSMG